MTGAGVGASPKGERNLPVHPASRPFPVAISWRKTVKWSRWHKVASGTPQAVVHTVCGLVMEREAVQQVSTRTDQDALPNDLCPKCFSDLQQEKVA
jgi:hypothetical protein